MAEAGDQQSNVDPRAAREFLSAYVPDPKMVATMPDPDVVAYHGRVRTAVDAQVQEAIKQRGDFGPDWRKSIAGDNAAAMPTLERFQTPKALWESYESLRTKISNGELKSITPFPANGTDEQKGAWRSEHGIPTKPEEYKIEPPQGVVLGDADKPFIEGWAKYAHGKNLNNDVVNAGVAWWAEERVRRQEAAAQQQATLKQETEDTLRTEWGAEYRPSMTRIEGLIEANLPDGSPMRDAIMGSVATSPEFANFMAKIAFQLNPSSLPMPAGADGQIKTVTEWLTKANQMMRTDRKAYNSSEYSKDYAKYATAYKAQTGKDWGKG